MKSISDPDFLAWAAEAGLVPDHRYPLSRPQLIFTSCPDCWGAWPVPRGPEEPAKFVRTLIGLFADEPLRIRMRGGGVFASAPADSERERALQSAVAAVGIPIGASGGFEFEEVHARALLDLAVAFLSFGYCLGTDLEIVPTDRRACLMLSHHNEVVA